jgi:hypothetical protein
MMEFFPLLLLVGSLIVYFSILLKWNEIDYKTALYLEFWILIASCVYAFVQKAIQMTKPEGGVSGGGGDAARSGARATGALAPVQPDPPQGVKIQRPRVTGGSV